jgi:glucan-binding YG repeat protein
MANEAKYWILANKAAQQLGWLPQTVFTQWAWETAHFTSANLLNNNNIAGQTWYQNCGHEKGTPRPKNEGGWYIKYEDAAQGYVEFIKNNIRRYGNVSGAHTVESQIDLIAKDGWAADPHYAIGLKSLHQANLRDGIYDLPRAESGWVKNNDIWYYYKNGALLKNNWIKHTDGHWYFLKADGKMAAGEWVKYKNNWYYLDTTGAMKQGWVQYKNNWYYLNPAPDKGEMLTGWIKNKGKTYYCNPTPDKGEMFIGSHLIDGKTYVFDNSGALIS